MTSRGRRRVLLEKRALIGLSYLTYYSAREAETRSGFAASACKPRVHGRWVVQLMRMSLETYAVLY